MHDHARRAKTRIHDSHILHAGLLPDPAKNPRRVSNTHETLISSKRANTHECSTCPLIP